MINKVKEMSEEIESLLHLLEISYCSNCELTLSYKQSQKIRNYINELQQGNQQLKIQVSSREEVANKYKEVIDKAMEMINDYIPEEYVRSCDTEDGIGRYELDTDSWQYKVYEMLKELE